MDCIHNAYNQVKKDKDETTIFVHGYLQSRNNTPAIDLVSGTDNNKFFSYIHIALFNVKYYLN